jgi:outer membrane protein assembly factor BamB
LATGGAIRATPVLDAQNILYTGSRDNHLYAVDAESGQILWKKEFPDQIDSTVAIAAGQKLIFGCDNGTIYFLGKK